MVLRIESGRRRQDLIWARVGEMGGATYLCSNPQDCGGETEAGRGKQARVGEVEGQEDHVPEEILVGKREC